MKNVLILISLLVSSFLSQAQAVTHTDSVSLDVMIGQMILTGIGDFSYLPKDAEILAEIAAGKVGGVIFFEKNINEKQPEKQLKRSIEMLNAQAVIPLFVSIDEEGGLVNRLKPKYGFPETRTAGFLGELNDLDSTAFYATNTASTLSNLGFNLNYAPDVDVAINPNNPIIAKVGRSYSADPSIVARHAQKVMEIHHDYNVLTVLKHFPGHGSSKSDTHKGVADVTNFWQFSELMPYKMLLDSGIVDGIMSAHIINGHLDPDKLPATLSPYIINTILRGFLDFDGVVFSDDMQMHAISKNFGFETSIKMAINAGVDVMLFANNVPGNERRTPSEIHAIIKGYVASGEINEDKILKSYQRIMALKAKL